MADMIEEPPAASTPEALRRVMRDLPAIGKTNQASQQQGGYSYRGIEAITRVLEPLLERHGVIFVPEVLNYEVRDCVVGGKPWTDVILTVRYTVYGPGEPIFVGPLIGIGRDGADKGANKAMTQAWKYALIQTLCIADEKDDGDAGSHEAEYARPTEADREGIERLRARVELLDTATRDQFMAWRNDHDFPWPWPPEAVDAMNAELDRLISADRPEQDSSPEPPTATPPADSAPVPPTGTGETADGESQRPDLVPEDAEARAAAAAAQLAAVELRNEIEREVGSMALPAVRDTLTDFGLDSSGHAGDVRPRLIERLVIARTP